MKNYKIKELTLRKSFKLVALVISGPGIKELDPTTHTFIQDNQYHAFQKIPILRWS